MDLYNFYVDILHLYNVTKKGKHKKTSPFYATAQIVKEFCAVGNYILRFSCGHFVLDQVKEFIRIETNIPFDRAC